MKTVVIIPSGGKGLRVGDSLPKQYIQIHGKELIYYTIKIFQDSPEISEIVIAAQSEYFPLLNSIAENNNLTKITRIVSGGETRQQSVYNALNSIHGNEKTLVAVHDAVRPFLHPCILSEGIKTAIEIGSAVVAIPAVDTLIEGNEFVINFPDRKKIYYAQTPQIFRYDIIKSAFDQAQKENFYGTDESMIVKHAGFPIKIVEGSPLNIKITTKDDFKIADNILSIS